MIIATADERPFRRTSFNTDARSNTRNNERDGYKRSAKARLVELLFAAGCAEAAKKVARCNSNYFALACQNGHSAKMLCHGARSDEWNRDFEG